MKCPNCGFENKQDVKICKKCGFSLIVEPLWKPSLLWHIKVLVVIYLILTGVYFLLNHLLKPFMRQVPVEITPWLKKNENVKR